MKILLNSTKALLSFLVLVTLAACTGSKNVVTYDNSVEYRNAISLPPLKKLSQQNTVQTPNPEINSVSEIDSEYPLEPDTPVVFDVEPILETEETDQIIEDSLVLDQHIDEEQKVVINDASTEKYSINARVIEPNSNSARLQIEEGFTTAWEYLSDNLKQSDITVYNKNQAAQRVAIGCGDMEEEPIVTKRGGWSFFNKKPQQTEHCSLQLASSKSNTTVAVLSRSGEEVSASAAKELFSRLLNN